MPDQFSPAERSRVMRAVKSGDTTPELIVRRLIHALGYRYRLHGSDLPGKPDIVLPRLGKAVFVHGCFWHRCPRCNLANPKAHSEFWERKFALNVERDARKRAQLEAAGWLVLEVWECDVRDRLAESVERVAEALASRPGRRPSRRSVER